MSTKKWIYRCVVTTCGYIDYVTFAPAATKRCPACAGMLKREPA